MGENVQQTLTDGKEKSVESYSVLLLKIVLAYFPFTWLRYAAFAQQRSRLLSPRDGE